MTSDPSVIGLITAGLTEVKEAVNALSRDLHSTLARLPNEYVPRRELERRIDELVIDIGAVKASCESSAKASKEAQEKADADRIAGRRWVIGLAVATACSMTGVITGVFLHFT